MQLCLICMCVIFLLISDALISGFTLPCPPYLAISRARFL